MRNWVTDLSSTHYVSPKSRQGIPAGPDKLNPLTLVSDYRVCNRTPSLPNGTLSYASPLI